MPDPTEEELARLRVRAYGPDADLDEAGLARLTELEAALSSRGPSAARTPEPDPEREAGPAPQPVAAEEPPPAAEPKPVPLIAPVSLTAEPAPRTLDRRVRAAWVLSILVTAAVAAGLTAWTLPWGVRDDQHHAARLTEQPGTPDGAGQWNMSGLEVDELRSFGSYAGLEVYATDACIIVATAPLSEPGSGTGMCAGAGLEPVVEFHVPRRSRASAGDFGYPEEMRDHFPDGIVLRFTRQGDVILVDEGALPPGF
ncbi:hypothetical protein [Microbacterium sp. RG1]|uniref:hypothetical protein n=1 Tax=Microbacterium sp. RG1 TaxID=2489212 RepID=UPI0010CA4087|nr:hypothetical protein [Microbacterium sp. RG1]QCQ17351.1 hypothetical protein EHF32_11780 [Microbacterium sp. RG1]